MSERKSKQQRRETEESAKYWLDRAVTAEEENERLTERVEDLKSRLEAALGMGPVTAVQALAVLNRCETAENLVTEIVRRVEQGALTDGQLPGGWFSRAQVALKAADVAKRDVTNMERPPDDEYWNQSAPGTRPIIKRRGNRGNQRPPWA